MKIKPQNHFIEAFVNKLEEVSNKDFLIKNEINQIELFTSREDNLFPIKSLSDGGAFSSQKTRSVFNLSYFGAVNTLNAVFHEYVLHGTLDNIQIEKHHFNKSSFDTGVLFGEYYLWLKELESNPLNKPKKSKLNHQQKLLALQYLGLDLRQFDDTKAGFVLSQILDLNEINTRKILPKIYFNSIGNDVRTKESFTKLLKLFENQQFDDISTRIKEDMNSLK